MVTMESEVGQHAQEESDILGELVDQFDLTSYAVDSVPTINDNCSVRDEAGSFPEVNCNIQTKNNDMQIILQTPAPVTQTFTPPQELPPVNNEVEGLPISNSGKIVTSHTTAAFSGGENQGDDPLEGMDVTRQPFQEMDKLLESVNPNPFNSAYSNQIKDYPSQPMTDNSNHSSQVLLPVKNTVEGPVVSKTNLLVTSHTTATFSGGENQGDDSFEGMETTGQTFQEMDKLLESANSNLYKSAYSNPITNYLSPPMTGNSNPAMIENSNQVTMDNSSGVMMEISSQAIMENSNYNMMETGPMEETAAGAFAVQVNS